MNVHFKFIKNLYVLSNTLNNIDVMNVSHQIEIFREIQ